MSSPVVPIVPDHVDPAQQKRHSAEAPRPDAEHTGVAEYNPEWKPNGIEGGLNTNKLPWVNMEQAQGLSFKPMRASAETGFFSICVRMAKGSAQPNVVHLGAMDFMVLSGSMQYPDGPVKGTAGPGTWGFIPANARVGRWMSEEGCELLANFYGPVAFLDEKNGIQSVFTAADVGAGARRHGIPLIPNTLADAMQARPEAYTGPAEPLEISKGDGAAICTKQAETAPATSPHFVDTRKVPWINSPGSEIGLKILRVSAETGTISLIVRHNGVAPPHYHLGAADFMVLSGQIGYRAGPPEGYGPGMWFYEPAGSRHEATQRVPGSTDDLIYTANVYGPIQFDEGVGTPITMVLSWMQYLDMAKQANAPLVKSSFAGDASMLAWAPLGLSPAEEP